MERNLINGKEFENNSAPDELKENSFSVINELTIQEKRELLEYIKAGKHLKN